ncbi:unnamed protein product [Adineta ricciae]|nr:unnamed protein product [Adineta ricciae]
MSAVANSMLRQTSMLTRACFSNLSRPTFLPFSTTAHRLTESSSKSAGYEGKSFDSVPVHLSPLGKVVMVLGGLHSRLSDVPDSIPNRIYQKTKDKFRARCVVASLFGTGLLALIAAMRGKSAKKEGKRYTDSVFEMHRGESRLHEQLESAHRHRNPSERYSPAIDEINK